ncbi:hypothetical protein [Flavobacterium sp.]|jgi:hypothetical protein|uniref:hypothetical protein n=1 Tax=Flavobacterium sp. TaxID=239 RepID=UPI0037BF021A
MNYQEALGYLDLNLSKFQELYPNSIFIISPYLYKDLERFIKDINEKGINNVDVKDYSSDGRFGVYEWRYRAL